MGLLLLIILATVSYTLFDLFAALAGNKIDSNISATIFNGIGTVFPIATYLIVRFHQQSKIITSSKFGILYSIFAGISIAIFSILLIKIYEKGGLSYVVPLIYGGSIVLASIIGILFLKEQTSIMQIIGIIVVAVGISLIVISKV
jgi:uncharacterized membrane protein